MIDFKQHHSPEGPVVELTGAGLPLLQEYDVGMDQVSLTLRQGELGMVLLEHGEWNHPVADVISGLVSLEQGSIHVFGHDWSTWGPDEQSMARWRIGRVFEGHGWLSNLDVDENITLSERHHTSRPVEEIEAEMMRLAGMVGLDDFPHGRPSLVDREMLRRAEWVRAALGSPWLVLLERPGRDLANGWLPDMVSLVNHLRHHGAAVLWLAEDESECRQNSLNPTLKLAAKQNTLVPVVTP